MPYKEKEIKKLYYTIGEVAQMFKVNTSHIRFWSKHFDEIKPATNKKGNRLYTPEDIEIIKRIYHLVKKKGYTLKGAQVEMQKMRKKMRLEGKAITVPALDAQTSLFDEDTAATHDAFQQRSAVKKSLLKIREMLLQVQKEVEGLSN
jgi:DNA-binding transcriptional MerR regulator